MFCNFVHFQMQKFQEGFQVLQSGQGRRSKEFFVKREEHHSNKYKELQTSSNKELKESATKLGSAKATIEDLEKKLESALNTIMARDDEIIDLKGSLGEATKKNKKLEKDIVNLKTTHGEEKNGYEAKIAKLGKALELEKDKNNFIDLGLKIEHELGNEKAGHAGYITKLEEELKVAKVDQKEFEKIHISVSDQVRTGMTLIAGAKDEDPENLFAAGKKALLSVHKDLSKRERGQGTSRSAKRRSNKRKRVEAELDMPQNGNIGDDEVEGNDADGSFQLEERV